MHVPPINNEITVDHAIARTGQWFLMYVERRNFPLGHIMRSAMSGVDEGAEMTPSRAVVTVQEILTTRGQKNFKRAAKVQKFANDDGGSLTYSVEKRRK